MVKVLLLGLVAVACSTSCRPPDGCIPRSTRCLVNHSQICDADRYWRELSDCDRVSVQSGASFACRYVDEETEEGRVVGHTCMPATDDGSEASR